MISDRGRGVGSARAITNHSDWTQDCGGARMGGPAVIIFFIDIMNSHFREVLCCATAALAPQPQRRCAHSMIYMACETCLGLAVIT